MPAITLNPGFVLILGALALFVTPQRFRAGAIALACAASMWLLLDRNFGAAGAVAQIGLPVVLLDLDALNQVFGIALIAVTLLIATYASARRHPFEDGAILLMAGGAVSALFVGDLISFLAAAELAGLAAVWTLFASPLRGASEAGARLLIWHGLEGLLFLIGVAFHLSAGADNSIFERLNPATVGGGFVLAALLIRVGAPGAHVWLKDAASHGSAAGGAAIAVISPMIGVYALARLFPTAPALLYIGEAMIVLGALLAAAEDDLRRASAYALVAHIGVCLALIGVASPQADVSAHAFTVIFAFALLLMALGVVLTRTGSARVSNAAGLARQMPQSFLFVAFGLLAVCGTPGLAPYITLEAAQAASAHWPQRVLWSLIEFLMAVLAAGFAVRAIAAMARPNPARPMPADGSFPMLLGAGLALFLCLAVGIAPDWLYALTPSTLRLDPYTTDRLAPQLELLGTAGAAYLALLALGLAPTSRGVSLLDLDALYRGPIAAAGRWSGGVLARFYVSWGEAWRRGWRQAGARLTRWTAHWDLPRGDQVAGLVQFIAVALVLVIILFTRL